MHTNNITINGKCLSLGWALPQETLRAPGVGRCCGSVLLAWVAGRMVQGTLPGCSASCLCALCRRTLSGPAVGTILSL